jgi:hypothetical protein
MYRRFRSQAVGESLQRIQPADQNASVEKPFGSVGGKGYQLQHRMELADDKDIYKEILVSVDLDANAITQ